MSEITSLHDIDLNSGYITKPRWSLDGRYLAIPTESGSIAIFDIKTTNILQTLGYHSAAVTAVDWNREGDYLMTGSLDRSVGVWDVRAGERISVTVSGHKEPVHSVQWTDEGAYAMTCSADRVRALDGACLAAGWTAKMEDAANNATQFTAAACSYQTTLLLAAATRNGSLLVLVSLVSAELLDQMIMEHPVTALAWSPAENLIAAGTARSILLIPVTGEKFDKPRVWTDDTADTHALALSSDGKLLASLDAQGLKIRNVRTGSVAATSGEGGTSLTSTPHAGIAFHPFLPFLVAVKGTVCRIFDVSDLA